MRGNLIYFPLPLIIIIKQISRPSLSRTGRKPTSEVILAAWKSIMMDRLKSGRITPFRLSPLASILETHPLLIILLYII